MKVSGGREKSEWIITLIRFTILPLLMHIMFRNDITKVNLTTIKRDKKQTRFAPHQSPQSKIIKWKSIIQQINKIRRFEKMKVKKKR